MVLVLVSHRFNMVVKITTLSIVACVFKMPSWAETKVIHFKQ